MKRPFLLIVAALLLPLAALAQTPIRISFTYTPGALAQANASSFGSIQNAITQALIPVNNAYASSGINAAFTFLAPSPAGNTAPADSRSTSDQYVWARSSRASWQSRTNQEASITVHITAGTDVNGAYQSSTAGTGGPRESVIVIPFNYLNTTAFEYALSNILNKDCCGYANRTRSLPTDPYVPSPGNPYCYHTRESGPSNPNQVVPYLSYWQTNIGPSQAQTQAATSEVSCETARLILINSYGCGANCTSKVVHEPTPPSTTGWCLMKNAAGQDYQYYDLNYSPATGGSTIGSCTEWTINLYSKNGTLPNDPTRPRGNASADNVGYMNIRKDQVYQWSTLNASILAGKTASTALMFLCMTIPNLCKSP